jgi:hypothetical protein
MSVSPGGSGDRPRGVRMAPWRAATRARRVAGVNLYIVPRTRAWLSEEELAAAADCVPAVNETLRDDVRWIRSYVVDEEDGTFSAFCIYEATGPEVLRRHADALGLPTDAIKRVATTIVANPDPEPAGAA